MLINLESRSLIWTSVRAVDTVAPTITVWVTPDINATSPNPSLNNPPLGFTSPQLQYIPQSLHLYRSCGHTTNAFDTEAKEKRFAFLLSWIESWFWNTFRYSKHVLNHIMECLGYLSKAKLFYYINLRYYNINRIVGSWNRLYI